MIHWQRGQRGRGGHIWWSAAELVMRLPTLLTGWSGLLILMESALDLGSRTKQWIKRGMLREEDICDPLDMGLEGRLQ